MQMETMKCKKKCADCMYCKKNNECIRKKKKVWDKDLCLHFVEKSNRHSMETLIEKMAGLFLKESE